jgi:hypothetical protein
LLKSKKLGIDARKPFRRWTNPGSFSEWSSFVKDVRTLAGTANLVKILDGIRQLDSMMDKPGENVVA